MWGTSIEDKRVPSTRNLCPFLFQTLCRRILSKYSGPRYVTSCVIPLPSLKMILSWSINNMLIASLSASLSESADNSWLSKEIMFEGLLVSDVKFVTVFTFEEWACVQNDLYAQNPLSKRSSGRPDTRVGYVFLNCPKDQASTSAKFLDLMQVSSSGFPFALRNFSASYLVERRLTGELGWYRELSKMKICCVLR